MVVSVSNSVIRRCFKRPPPVNPDNNATKKNKKASTPHRLLRLRLIEGGLGEGAFVDEDGNPAYTKTLSDALESGEAPELEWVGKHSIVDPEGAVMRYTTRGSSPRTLPVQRLFFGASSHEELIEKGDLLATLFKEKVKPFTGGRFEVTVIPTNESDNDESLSKLHEVVGVFRTSEVVCQLFYDHLIAHGLEGLDEELDKYYVYSEKYDTAAVGRIIRYKFTEMFQVSLPNSVNAS